MRVTTADGKKIRKHREAADLTIDELVDALIKREKLKRHPDTLRNIELGHTQPSQKLLNAIVRIFDVPRDDLLADDDAQVQRA